MWIDFNPVQGTEAFHGNDAEYASIAGLHDRNAQHTRELVADAQRLGAVLPAPHEVFGTSGPTQFDVVDLPPIPRAEMAAPSVGSRAIRLAS